MGDIRRHCRIFLSLNFMGIIFQTKIKPKITLCCWSGRQSVFLGVQKRRSFELSGWEENGCGFDQWCLEFYWMREFTHTPLHRMMFSVVKDKNTLWCKQVISIHMAALKHAGEKPGRVLMIALDVFIKQEEAFCMTWDWLVSKVSLVMLKSSKYYIHLHLFCCCLN